MEKLKNALKSVNKFGLAAIMLVALATMAFTPAKNLALKKYSYNPSAPAGSHWTNITGQTQQTPGVPGQYRCESSTEICTGEFEESVNPNIGSPTPSNVVLGDFESIN